MTKHNITPDELERIERFLQNDLPPHERRAFEERLTREAAFREKTEQVQLMILGISEVALEEKMKQFRTRLPAQQASRGSRLVSFRLIAVAASVLLIVSLTIWMFFFNNTTKNDLYANYYKPDPGLMTPMGSEENYDFGKAMVAYRNRQYPQAISAWNRQLQTYPSNDTLIYFLGAAYQAMGQTDSAAAYLGKIASRPTSQFYRDANWYMALLSLRSNNRSAALAYLRHSGHDKSGELLQKLEK